MGEADTRRGRGEAGSREGQRPAALRSAGLRPLVRRGGPRACSRGQMDIHAYIDGAADTGRTGGGRAQVSPSPSSGPCPARAALQPQRLGTALCASPRWERTVDALLEHLDADGERGVADREVLAPGGAAGWGWGVLRELGEVAALGEGAEGDAMVADAVLGGPGGLDWGGRGAGRGG